MESDPVDDEYLGSLRRTEPSLSDVDFYLRNYLNNLTWTWISSAEKRRCTRRVNTLKVYRKELQLQKLLET